MRSKGFTLIELLAVIVILAIIALIATPIILNIIDNAREESNKRSIELYKHAVETALVAVQASHPDAVIKNADDLKALGYLKEYDNIDCIITIDNYKITDFKEKSCKINGVLVYSDGEKEENATIGCTSNVVAAAGSYTSGDSYDCTVSTSGEEHKFYVLSDNNDGTVTMLMAENLNGTTTWNNKNTFLTSKTSSWTLPKSVSVPSATQLGCPSGYELEEGYCSGQMLSFAATKSASEYYWTSTEYVPDAYAYYVDSDYLGWAGEDGYTCHSDWDGIPGCDYEPDVALFGIRPVMVVDKNKLN